MAMSILPEMGWTFVYAVPSMQHMFWASFLATVYHLMLTIPDTCSTLLGHPNSLQTYRNLQNSFSFMLPTPESTAVSFVQDRHGVFHTDDGAAAASGLSTDVDVGSLGNSCNTSSTSASPFPHSAGISSLPNTSFGTGLAGSAASNKELESLHMLCHRTGGAALIVLGLLLPLALLFTLTDGSEPACYFHHINRSANEALLFRTAWYSAEQHLQWKLLHKQWR
jgi:hypothetical protein